LLLSTVGLVNVIKALIIDEAGAVILCSESFDFATVPPASRGVLTWGFASRELLVGLASPQAGKGSFDFVAASLREPAATLRMTNSLSFDFTDGAENLWCLLFDCPYILLSLQKRFKLLRSRHTAGAIVLRHLQKIG
jgi:hypothetical protein